MPKLVRLSAYFASILVIAHCSSTPSSDDDDDSSGGSSGKAAGGSAGKSASGGSSATGGAGGAGGSTGGATAGTGATSGGSGGSTGGTGGSTGGTGGSTGGSGGSTGGSSATGGASGTGGSIEAGGAGGAGGSSGGAGGSSGAAAMGGMGAVDQMGTPLAKPGDQKTGSREYLNLGDIRLLNNKWGSDELGCNTTMRVFVTNNKTLGWDFNRGTCGGMAEKPDYPELEFGVHPFGAGNALATSPNFASTLVLPKQMKDITTASVNLGNFAITLQNMQSWNMNFEFWLSQRNPLTEADPGVYAELIIFWGWENGRWPCDKTGNVTAGDQSYHLCHQDDAWADGKWRYFQFWVNNGPTQNFSGRVDVKALMDWLVNNYGYSRDLWVTRFEVGTEIDDNTSGTATLQNISFEVNGTSKSPEFGQ